MKTTPYELVFGQPPRQSVFPGAKVGSQILEEDVEDLLDDEPPSKLDEPPSKPDEPPSKSDEPPSKSDEPPSKPDEPPSKPDEPPSKPDEPPSKPDEPPSKPDEPPSKPDEPPSKPDESLSKLDKPFLATSQKHKKIREEADARYRLNAERMQLKYSKGKRKKVSILALFNVLREESH